MRVTPYTLQPARRKRAAQRTFFGPIPMVRGAPSKPSRGVLVSLVSPNLVMDVTRARTVITGFAVTADTGLGPGGS
jgi:hypothetical protein